MIIQVRPEAPKPLENILKCIFSFAKWKSNKVNLLFSISGEKSWQQVWLVYSLSAAESLPTIPYPCVCTSFPLKSCSPFSRKIVSLYPFLTGNSTTPSSTFPDTTAPTQFYLPPYNVCVPAETPRKLWILPTVIRWKYFLIRGFSDWDIGWGGWNSVQCLSDAGR